jgi:hypothetical protein
MLKAVQKSQLIDKDSSQSKALSREQTFVSIKDAFEMLIFGSEFRATAHDDAHYAFMTLRPLS